VAGGSRIVAEYSLSVGQ